MTTPPERGLVRLDVAARRVWQGDQELAVPRRLFDVLTCLAVRAGTVVTYEDLVRTVWGPGWVGTPKTVGIAISELRRILSDDATAPRYITTVHSVGIRFEADALAVTAPPQVHYRLPLFIGQGQVLRDADGAVVAMAASPAAAEWLLARLNAGGDGVQAPRGDAQSPQPLSRPATGVPQSPAAPAALTGPYSPGGHR